MSWLDDVNDPDFAKRVLDGIATKRSYEVLLAKFQALTGSHCAGCDEWDGGRKDRECQGVGVETAEADRRTK
jgi:hypothetical protein